MKRCAGLTALLSPLSEHGHAVSCPKVGIASSPYIFLSLPHQKPWYLHQASFQNFPLILHAETSVYLSRNGQLAVWELIFLQPNQRNTQAKDNQNYMEETPPPLPNDGPVVKTWRSQSGGQTRPRMPPLRPGTVKERKKLYES